MLATLLLLIAAGMNPAAARFAGDHPKSTRVVDADGNLAHASGFLVDTGLRDPASSARAFLAESGDAFGLAGEALVLEGAPAAGEVGAVRFSRSIGGLPVFGSALVVGVDGRARPFIVNSGRMAPAISGSHRIGNDRASTLAIGSIGARGVGPATVLPGWRSFPGTTRAVYRVDFIATQPAGDWRVFVDGETGSMLFRQNLRYRATAPAMAFDVSPVESASALCPASGTGGLSFCNQATPVTLQNLKNGADLTGTQTTVFNCNGQNAPTSSAPGLCVVVPKNAGGDFNFTADSTFRSPTDNFSAVMAYQHLDKHVSFFKALDSNLPTAGQSRALVGSMPALVNAFEGNAPLENAFFSGSLDAMVFGQGAAADFAYDATVMYHEFTHGVVFAWGDFNIDIDSLGGLDEPGALNEGTADSMAVSETGRSSIGGFIGSTSNPPAPNLRDMNDPGISKSCQGDGTVVNQFGASSVNGFDGEVHDDGEVWNGFYWEVFSGLKAAGIKGCGGTCEAGPAIQYKALQLAGGTSPTFNNYWQTFKSAAGAMFASQPTVAAYVDCVAKRRKLYRCDRTVPLYAGETKVQFVRLRYSPFQVALQATGATQFNFCSAQGISTTVYARAGTPVVLSVIDPNTGNATITADVHQTFTQACSGGPVSFPLPAPTGGVWYLLVDAPDALVGANPGFELYRFDAASTGMAARPASSAAGTCTNPGPLQISGPTSLPPRGHQTFAATGGSTTGYTWSILTNNSGGSIGASSGVYTAGATGSVSDVARVIDLIGGIKTQTVSVTAGVTLTPPAAMLAPGAKLTFAAAGGSGTGFVWTLTSNGSGGTMDASGGYTAGPTGNATDIVTATDSLGNAGTATVTVASKGGGCASGGTGDAAAMLAIAAVLLGRQLLRRRPA